jgi:hypothetical protein
MHNFRNIPEKNYTPSLRGTIGPRPPGTPISRLAFFATPIGRLAFPGNIHTQRLSELFFRENGGGEEGLRQMISPRFFHFEGDCVREKTVEILRRN